MSRNVSELFAGCAQNLNCIWISGAIWFSFQDQLFTYPAQCDNSLA
jgi:hypothetical protein